MPRLSRFPLVAALGLFGCTEDGAPPAREEAPSAAVLSTEPARAQSPGRPEKETKRRPKSILLAEARELVGWRVADGFLSRDRIVALAVEAADGRESLRPDLERLVDEELAAHRSREKDWHHLTDADRLMRAFVSLERSGVIAREHFADCRTCGQADMQTLREDLLDQGKRADGYVFFTERDAEGVSKSGELVLEYGSFRAEAEATARIGARVAEALRREALSVVDQSDEESPYLVLTDLEWRRRRFSRPPGRAGR